MNKVHAQTEQRLSKGWVLERKVLKRTNWILEGKCAWWKEAADEKLQGFFPGNVERTLRICPQVCFG